MSYFYTVFTQMHFKLVELSEKQMQLKVDKTLWEKFCTEWSRRMLILISEKGNSTRSKLFRFIKH